MRYQDLAEIFERLEGTSKRLEKTFYISQVLRQAPKEDITPLMMMLRGKVFPDWDERKIGVAAKIVAKAISQATGASETKIHDSWRETGDLGTVAQNLTKTKVQATLGSVELTIQKVYSNFKKLADLTGIGTVSRKLQLISELMTSASPLEAKYIVRSLLEELRVGVGEGSIRDAIAWAFFPPTKGIFVTCECGAVNPKVTKCLSCGKELSKSKEEEAREEYNELTGAVQHAYNMLNEFSEVAVIAKEKGLEGLKGVNLDSGHPIKVMLAQKVGSVKEAFERVGRPAALEYKYDGFRMQVHKGPNGVRIFTRRLENVSAQFPEVVEHFKSVGATDFIIDGEAVGYEPSTGKYLPFQHVSQRIRRKYGIEEMAKKLPVELNLFDIMLLNGENMMKKPLTERRKALEGLFQPEKGKVVFAKQLLTEDDAEAEAFYQESLARGNEGIMFKSLESVYKPGSRVGFMVKLKPTMECLDLVITGAEWGEGKRAHWFTSFTMSCVADGDYLEIGKVGTGIKELEESEGVTFQQLTDALKPNIIEQKGREVDLKPVVVVEIKFEEIQKSPTYGSGYALRFPRVVRVRDDLKPEGASTLDLVEDFFDSQ